MTFLGQPIVANHDCCMRCLYITSGGDDHIMLPW
jgi:hypothetical protein